MKKDANYNKAKQKQPERPMGHGDFANMPREIVMKEFAGPRYRDGITNSFVDSVEDTSDICENHR
jgi:hypothetical protein